MMNRQSINGIEIPENKLTTIDMEVAHLPTRTPISIPIYIYKSNIPGPAVLFSAGLHGDEINGVEIVRRIIEEKLYAVKKGTVICIPIINIYGFLNFSRYVPDGKDVNRSFPGHANGSLASKVAYNITNHVIPNIDFGIDFHTGGDQRANYPQIRCNLSDKKTLELAEKTKAPFLIHSNEIEGTFREEANRQGKALLVYEGGESLRYDRFAIEEGVNCAHRLLHSFNMSNEDLEPYSNSIIITKRKWYRSPNAGMWISHIKYGDYIEEGTLLGFITGPFGDFKSEIYAEHSGFVIGFNNQAVVNKGDAILNIGIIDKSSK